MKIYVEVRSGFGCRANTELEIASLADLEQNQAGILREVACQMQLGGPVYADFYNDDGKLISSTPFLE